MARLKPGQTLRYYTFQHRLNVADNWSFSNYDSMPGEVYSAASDLYQLIQRKGFTVFNKAQEMMNFTRKHKTWKKYQMRIVEVHYTESPIKAICTYEPYEA